ncbi:hypothetical protein BJ166DRAFT_587241 [Pestalotiopsis sp. NC0098]|nr:hypothetical protein BJ166DRAFT_587241 [Pestalotiopsis sp. NC0098]
MSSAVAMHVPITIIWGSTDLSLFPADVVSSRYAILSPSTTTTASNSSDTITLSSSADAPQPGTGTSLSQPARIGIGVGAAVGVLFVIIMISAWLCKIRRRRRALPVPARNNAQELDGGQPIWKRFFGREWRAELPRDGRTAELDAAQQPSELTAAQSPVELPGSYQFPMPAAETVEKKERHAEPAS